VPMSFGAFWARIATLFALSAATLAAAQDRGDVELAPVTVRLPQRPSRDASAQVTVIDIAKRDGEAVTTPGVLLSAPGLSIIDHGGGQMVTLSIRGSNSDQVLVTLDGLPLSSVAGGGTDLSFIPPALLERAEVVRGAVGARYGSGALGGAVDLTLRRFSGSLPVTASIGAGSFGTTFADAAVNVPQGSGGLVGIVHVDRADGNFTYPFNPTRLLEGSSVQWLERLNNDSRSASALVRYSGAFGSADVDALAIGDTRERGIPGPAQDTTLDDREARYLLGGIARLRAPLWGGAFDAQSFVRADGVNLTLASIGAPGERGSLREMGARPESL
jgi:vitamin B12 transporter